MFNAANFSTPLGSALVRPSIGFLLTLIALPVFAQNEPSAQPAAGDTSLQFITPFFTADTVAVADVDLSAIDPVAISGWLQEHAGTDEAAIAPIAQMAGGLLMTLRGAGAERVYALAMQQDLPTAGAVLLIPCEQPDTVAGVLAAAAGAIPEPFGYQVHREDRLVVLAPANAWERIQARPAVDRPELTQALQSIADLPHRLAVALPERVRVETAELWPGRLPKQVPLQLSPRELMQDFRAKAVGWRLPPEPRVEVRITTAGADAAERWAEASRQIMELAAEVLPDSQVAVDRAQVVVELHPSDVARVISWARNPARVARSRMQDSNDLKQVGLAMHNYYATHSHLPPRATANADGQLLLSWRVMILPFIEQAAMYDQFHLDEPWDSTHNLAFAETLPETYAVGSVPLPPGQTRVRLPQIEGSLWSGEGPPLKFADITDGTSNTIAAAIAPASAAVVWTKPEPWELDESNLIESFFGDRESAEVLLWDGSVHVMPRTIGEETLRALLTHQGGEVVEFPED